MTRRLEGKVAIVSGAGSVGPGWGNGRATAVRFAEEGAAVVCADLDLDSAKETVAELEALGGKAVAERCDVAEDAEVAGAVASAVGTSAASTSCSTTWASPRPGSG